MLNVQDSCSSLRANELVIESLLFADYLIQIRFNLFPIQGLNTTSLLQKSEALRLFYRFLGLPISLCSLGLYAVKYSNNTNLKSCSQIFIRII
jgi:hypothetical protein